jgi:hypothetical protein
MKIDLLNQQSNGKLALKQLGQDNFKDATNNLGKKLNNMHKVHIHKVHLIFFYLQHFGNILYPKFIN